MNPTESERQELMTQTPCDADLLAPLAMVSVMHQQLCIIHSDIIQLSPRAAGSSLTMLEEMAVMLRERLAAVPDAT